MNKMDNEKPNDGDTAPGPASEGQRPAEASPNENASPTDDKVTMIRIEVIHVLNPRQRDKKEFEQIVLSIKNQGLKMPIQVSRREEHEPAGLSPVFSEATSDTIEIERSITPGTLDGPGGSIAGHQTGCGYCLGTPAHRWRGVESSFPLEYSGYETSPLHH